MFRRKITMSQDEIHVIAASDEKFRYFVIEEFMNQRERISKLEVKSGMWGLLGGIIVVIFAKFKEIL